MIIRRGDPEISAALAEGALAGMAARAALPGGLPEGQRQAVEAEIDRQYIAGDMAGGQGVDRARVSRALLKVAVNNTKRAEDYAMMRFDAEVQYGEPVDYPTPLRRLGDGLLTVYAMIVYAVASAFRAQNRVLGGSQ